MKKYLLKSVGFGTLLVLFTSCEKLPQAEIDSANQAIENTRVEAEMYAPEEFLALQDSLQVALQLVEQEKSGLFPSFKNSKAKLLMIDSLAMQTQQVALTKKEEMKAEVQAALLEVKTLLEENKTLITAAPKGKEGALALEQINQELGVIETSVNEISNEWQNGDYYNSKEKVVSVKEKASQINTELKDVLAKYNARRG